MGRTGDNLVDILAVYAHPDDESWSCGGLLSRCALKGLQAYLITATFGEAGFAAQTIKDTPEHERKRTRSAELGCAARLLGLTHVEIVGLPDGNLKSMVPALKEVVLQRLKSLCPRVVITFDETGVTGHRDHIAVHEGTKQAFLEADLRGSRLLYNVIPERVNESLREAMQTMGSTPAIDGFFLKKWQGLPEEEDGSAGAFCVPNDRVAVAVDVRDSAEIKRDAILCHKSQVGESTFLRSLPKEVLEAFLGWEYFQFGAGLRYPVVPADDIFEGMS